MNFTSKRKALKKTYEPFGVLLAKSHITPNIITIISIILGVLSAYFFFIHKPFTGAMLLFFSGFFDLMDGVVARETDRASKFGAVFDWLADKFVDGFVLFAIGMAYSTPWITILAVVTNQLHTFIKPVVYSEIGFSERKKGKIDDPLEGIGFFGRPETMLTIIIFAIFEHFKIFGGLEFGFKVIAVLTILSLMQRIFYLYIKYNKQYD
ncbi:CDP-alcohol phosphatidyltransferase family protein [Hydrogenothermus marinus]|uniref:Phosphatidylglycerophosphate synthase n=1 Tax=Hydrogenothermus marinus TaxID=133270 RepID=A0A3M0BNM0_9AQUI|nr:CDP-alcohol phosphatidyltransferase family protein [Hydrogenothermus marinus]RMA96005.1 phosphatidylglycerophosphate synthase [Hydrogenothermus marinus]